MKSILLFSSGLDSTLVLIKLVEEGSTIYPMYVKYNQWQVETEIRFIQPVVDWVSKNIGPVEPIIIPEVPFPVKVGHATGRSLLLTGLACMYSDLLGLGIDSVAAGFGDWDTKYPDLQEAGQRALATMLGFMGVDYVIPLAGWTKDEVGLELAKYKVPWDLMFTCFWDPPCGSRSSKDSYRCGGCRRKAIAMVAAGIPRSECRSPNVGI